MPTTRPRHFVTETDELRDALDAAAKRWPNESRARLLVRLALVGDRAIGREQDAARLAKQAAIRRSGGVLRGAYPADYLEQLREDWPG